MGRLLTVSKDRTNNLDFRGLASDTVIEWSDVCQKALDIARREMLEGDPSPEKLAEHRTAFKWFLRFARVIQATASDPEYPDRKIADELTGRLIQLQHCWRMIHEPMDDVEAEQLLKEVFPGGR